MERRPDRAVASRRNVDDPSLESLRVRMLRPGPTVVKPQLAETRTPESSLRIDGDHIGFRRSNKVGSLANETFTARGMAKKERRHSR